MKQKTISIIVSLLISIVLINLPFLKIISVGCDNVNCIQSITKDSLFSLFKNCDKNSFFNFTISTLFILTLFATPILFIFDKHKLNLLLVVVIVVIFCFALYYSFYFLLYGFYLILLQQSLLLIITILRLFSVCLRS